MQDQSNGDAPKRARALLPTPTMLGALLVLTALVYLPGLNGPLLLDDRANLAPLSSVGSGDLSAWSFILDDRALFRPVSRASFLLDWWLWGDQVHAFKAVNLLIHLICGLLVFALSRALFCLRLDATAATGAALGACALWLLAPLLASTVLYTVQRMAQLAAAFSLAGLLCYVYGRQRRTWGPLILSFTVFWPLSMLSKENGALLPLLAAVIEWWWFPRDAMARPARRLLLVLVGVPALLALGRAILNPGWIVAGYQGREFNLLERLLTQPRVLIDYLGNLLLSPGASPLGVFRDDVIASTSFTDPPTTAIALAALIVLAVAALISRGTRFAPAGFGIAFFLAAHGLESSVFALELYFEHRNYLPAVGIFIGVAALIDMAHHTAPRATRAATLLMIGLFAAITAQRTFIWSNEARLYAHSVQAHPESSRAWLGLAAAQFAAGRFDHGTRSLDRAATLMPTDAQAGIALQLLGAHCTATHGPPPEAYRRLDTARTLGGDMFTVNALAWMAGAVARGRCPQLDRARIATALRGLKPVSLQWDPPREQLRSQHLNRLLRTLDS